MIQRKAFFAVLLVLYLLCTVFYAASAAPRMLVQFSDSLTEPLSIAALEDALFVLQLGSLQRISLTQDASEMPELIWNDRSANSRIASLNGVLYLLSYENQSFSLERLSTDMLSAEACGEALNGAGIFPGSTEDAPETLLDFALLTETSWAALLRDSSGASVLVYGNHANSILWKLSAGNVTAIASAGDLALYAMLGTGELVRAEVPGGQQTTIAQMGGTAYAMASTSTGDTLFFADNQRVYQYTPEDGVRVYDRSPLLFQEPGLPACLVGDTYILGDFSGLYAVEAADSAVSVLSVAGSEDSALLSRFEEQYGIRVIAFDEGVSYDANALIQDMITQNGAYDLYTVYLSTGCLSALLQKGYAVPLDTSSTLVSALEAMDPNLTSLLRQGEHYAAFPKFAVANVLCVNTETLDTFGLTQDDLPGTFSDFLPWLSAQAETAEELNLTLMDSSFSLRRMTFGLLMDLYVEQCEKAHLWPDFESFLFPELLAQLDQYFPENTPMPFPEEAQKESDPPLLGYLDIGQGWTAEQGWIPLSLCLTEDLEPVIPIQITAYVINPYSSNQEESIAYLEYVSAQPDDETRLLLSKDPIAPVEDAKVMEEIALLEAEKERLTEALNSQTPEARDSLEKALAEKDAELRLLENSKWIVSPEDIERVVSYRSSFLASGESTFFADAAFLVGNYTSQFSAGSITAQELLQMLRRLSRMIALEGGD